MSREEQSVGLEKIVFIGRTFDEYMSMFDLSLEEMKGKKILDCPAGACSFTAEGNNKGLQVTACDIAYRFATEDIAKKGEHDIEHAMRHVEQAKDRYVWSYFKDVEDLKRTRLYAFNTFVQDRLVNQERYIYTELPSIPFADKSFELLLSAHFLFMYDDRLSYSFHLDTIKEFLRVAKEVRIFPLINLEGKRSVHINKMVAELSEYGVKAEEQRVSYEFQSGGHTILKLTRPTLK
ncbi:SAM-dependent methyltransferase [Alkalicoccobacillus porphyridii]|uniref:SAM-dependent methyltransferase n=1 Tax=Alkalicoccobacillus porphyridii TaxID=2597270 RepID=A0A553ZWY7_9BACI|nr:SAM-dependent methyltransferase [Alkalicoccobacillus porphyridii]TSB45961.1 SAM-dependent methyltransferase [Alkalicoccobacillus porphyridii]